MYIGGNETVPTDQREANALASRYLASQMLGKMDFDSPLWVSFLLLDQRVSSLVWPEVSTCFPRI